MKLVLDTSAYARLRGGHAQALELVARADAVLLPAIVLGELEAGFALGSRAKENRQSLRDFLDEPTVSVLPVTAAVAARYGQLFASLRRAGTPVPINDVWIAATTIEAAAHLLTFDRDFERVPHLDRTVL